jgi:hypothetical protein
LDLILIPPAKAGGYSKGPSFFPELLHGFNLWFNKIMFNGLSYYHKKAK